MSLSAWRVCAYVAQKELATVLPVVHANEFKTMERSIHAPMDDKEVDAL